jgi:hypothetical protein
MFGGVFDKRRSGDWIFAAQIGRIEPKHGGSLRRCRYDREATLTGQGRTSESALPVLRNRSHISRHISWADRPHPVRPVHLSGCRQVCGPDEM